MREIKFRGWHKKAKLMSNEATLQRMVEMDYSFSADDVEWLQFTGLHDKNGKEIYEGDIVVCKSYPFYGDAASDNPTFNELNYVGEVYYCTEEAGFYVDLRAVTDRVRGSACGGGLSEYADGEVIGNIYENPELLESADAR